MAIVNYLVLDEERDGYTTARIYHNYEDIPVAKLFNSVAFKTVRDPWYKKSKYTKYKQEIRNRFNTLLQAYGMKCD